MRMMIVAFGIAAFACGYLIALSNANANGGADPNDWLLNTESDQERVELLQRYLRGFDQPMWETGARYEAMYGALKRENYDLALYHWDKIRTTIQNGYLKRPKRQPNADRILLDDTWGEVRGLLASRTREAAWKGFESARTACMQCHVAEDVAYMNDQPVFELETTVSYGR